MVQKITCPLKIAIWRYSTHHVQTHPYLWHIIYIYIYIISSYVYICIYIYTVYILTMIVIDSNNANNIILYNIVIIVIDFKQQLQS